MSRRERFTPYEKEQACLDYINGNRSKSEICNCLHISTRTIQDWAAIYKKYGILGFTKKTKNRSYSKEFKMELVEKCISGEASSIDLGHQYDISSGLLRKWIRMYNANIELKDYNPKREVYMAKTRRKTTIDERKEIVNYYAIKDYIRFYCQESPQSRYDCKTPLEVRNVALSSEHPLSYPIAKNNKIEKYKSKWSA